MADSRPIVLASSSATRHEMLKSAGVAFTVDPADVDEAAIREALLLDNEEIDPADVAEVLARAKGEAVSRKHPDSLIIAADQVLAMRGEIFAKPRDDRDARAALMRLRGETHALHSCVVIAEGGEVVWSCCDAAFMTMRKFSAGFVSEYLLRAGSDVCQSVGAYQLEGLGIQLFERIEGDYFTILGLPLLPLLAELRERGALTT